MRAVAVVLVAGALTIAGCADVAAPTARDGSADTDTDDAATGDDAAEPAQDVTADEAPDEASPQPADGAGGTGDTAAAELEAWLALPWEHRPLGLRVADMPAAADDALGVIWAHREIAVFGEEMAAIGVGWLTLRFPDVGSFGLVSVQEEGLIASFGLGPSTGPFELVGWPVGPAPSPGDPPMFAVALGQWQGVASDEDGFIWLTGYDDAADIAAAAEFIGELEYFQRVAQHDDDGA